MISDKRTSTLAAAFLCAALLSCNRPAPPSSAAASAVAAPGGESPPEPVLHAPMTQHELPTTDGQIATDNLAGNLHAAQRVADDQPNDPMSGARVVALLCATAQSFGILANYDRAELIVGKMSKFAPKSAYSFSSRAKVHSIFHEFEPALADWEQAVKLDSDNTEPARISRATILAALGKTDEALAMIHAANVRRPEMTTMGLEAGLLAERGDLVAADDLFMRAQLNYGDVSPFPVAWLYFQHGLMWERADNLPRARDLYAAAVARLPTYAPAVAHFAAAEAARAQRDHAIALLRTLILTADDPEYKGQLAGLLKEAGDVKGADALRTQARTEYEALLVKHPLAFASHAARFFLTAGADPQAAHQWAEKNLAAFPTTDATSLATEAATAAGSGVRACALADQLTRRPYVSARAHVIASRAYSACGQRDRASAEIAAASKPSAK